MPQDGTGSSAGSYEGRPATPPGRALPGETPPPAAPTAPSGTASPLTAPPDTASPEPDSLHDPTIGRNIADRVAAMPPVAMPPFTNTGTPDAGTAQASGQPAEDEGSRAVGLLAALAGVAGAAGASALPARSGRVKAPLRIVAAVIGVALLAVPFATIALKQGPKPPPKRPISTFQVGNHDIHAFWPEPAPAPSGP